MYKKVYVEITNLCNMNCSFCHGHNRPPRQMTSEEFSLVLDQLSDQTQYIYYHLMGEPLTHPLLPQFIRMAGERGYKSIITTNGTLLKKRADELIAAGVHKVNLSVHSFETGSDEAHKTYIHQLVVFVEKAAAQGIIVVFRLWNQGCDNGRNQTTLQYLQEDMHGEWKTNTRGIKIRDNVYLEWGERFEWPDSKAQVKGTRYFCYGLKDQFGILSDGTVVPCCLDSDGVIHLGNIFTDDLSSILASPRVTDMVEGFRRGVATEDLCRRCGYAQRFV